MFGRSEDEENQRTGDWAGRVDRLLAGNLNQQVGSALESLARDFADLAGRVAALADLRDELTRVLAARDPDPGIAELRDRVAALAERVSEADPALEAIRAKIDALPSVEALAAAVRTPPPDLSGLQGFLRDIVEDASRRLVERMDAIDAAPMGSSGEEIAAMLEKRIEATERQIDNLGRQIGGALGRLRVQNDEIAQQTAGLPATLDAKLGSLPDASAFASLRTEVFEMLSSMVAQVSAAADVRMSAIAEDVSRHATELAEHSRLSAAGAAETLLARMAEMDRRVGALPDGERVAAIVETIRETAEQMRAERAEQFSTLSASIGAIYLRVRSLEQVITDLKMLAEKDESRTQISSLLQRVDEVATIEKHLADEIAAVQGAVRDGVSDRERDRELIDLLGELASEAAKTERGGLAERLRSFIARSRHQDGRAEGETGESAPSITVDLQAGAAVAEPAE